MTTKKHVGQDDVNAYLDAVRQTGAVNMMHGPALLRDEYGMDRAQAMEMFVAWTETFPRP